MAIVNGYATLDELKARLSRNDSAEDSLMNDIITAVSRQIDGFCDRRFYTETGVAKRFTASNGYSVQVPDLVSVTAVELDLDGDRTYETALLATDYELLPYDADDYGKPYTEVAVSPLGTKPFSTMRGGVRVTGNWGWPAIPAQVKEACLLQSIRLMKRKDAPYGVAGSGELGMVQFLPKIDSEIKALLEPFMMFRIGSF